jgi:DNA replication protein DnaC
MSLDIDATRLSLLLNDLRLPAIKQIWSTFPERSDTEGWPAARLLMALAEHEIAERDRRRVERHLRDGAFNRWMQHTEDRVSSRSVANETATPDLLQRDAEGADVGALAQGRIAAENCPAF